MAGVTLGFLKFALGFDTIAFKKGMTAAEKDLVVLQKKVAAFGKGMTDIGAKMSLAITAPLIAFAGKGIAEARETAKAMSEVNNALAQTGAVAGQTAPKLQAAADAFETKSLYEADQILSDVTANLLTFGKILPSNFQAAQQASVDLAQKLGIDLSAAAVAVGKALQNPVTGMKALKAIGVELTDAEKKRVAEMVKAGDAAKTQAFVLDLLASKTKNAAQAAQDADPWNALQDKFKALAESLGTVLLPFLDRLAGWATNMATRFQALSPETQKLVVTIGAIAAAVGPLLVILGTLVSTFAKLAPLVTGLAKAYGFLKTVMLATRVAAVSLLPALTPFLIPLAALATAVGAVYLAWKYWPQITKFVSDVYTAVKTWLVDKLAKVWAEVKAKIDAVVGWFKGMYDAVVGHSYVPDMVAGIAAEMAKLDTVLVKPAEKATGEMAKAFGDMAVDAIGSMKEMVATFKSGDILGGIQTLLDAVLRVVQALGQIGAMGGGGGAAPATAGARSGFGGFRAMGGPVVPGKSYMVGENGPEWFSSKKRGYINPTRKEAEAVRVAVVPSPYFDVVVEHTAAKVAAPMAGQAAIIGVTGAEVRMQRRSRRNLYAV